MFGCLGVWVFGRWEGGRWEVGGGRWEVGGGRWEVGVGGDSGVDILRHRSRSFDYLEKVVAWYRHCVSYSRMILSWSDAGHALSGYACVRALRAQYLRVRGGSVDDYLARGLFVRSSASGVWSITSCVSQHSQRTN